MSVPVLDDLLIWFIKDYDDLSSLQTGLTCLRMIKYIEICAPTQEIEHESRD